MAAQQTEPVRRVFEPLVVKPQPIRLIDGPQATTRGAKELVILCGYYSATLCTGAEQPDFLEVDMVKEVECGIMGMFVFFKSRELAHSLRLCDWTINVHCYLIGGGSKRSLPDTQRW